MKPFPVEESEAASEAYWSKRPDRGTYRSEALEEKILSDGNKLKFVRWADDPATEEWRYRLALYTHISCILYDGHQDITHYPLSDVQLLDLYDYIGSEADFNDVMAYRGVHLRENNPELYRRIFLVK